MVNTKREKFDKLGKDWDGLQYWILRSGLPKSLSKFIFVVCNFLYDLILFLGDQTIICLTNFCHCHLQLK